MALLVALLLAKVRPCLHSKAEKFNCSKALVAALL
jgi:hypothetical protein